MAKVEGSEVIGPAAAARLALLLAISLAAAAVGCRREPSRWEAAERESRRNPRAVSPEAVAGSSFNRFFPKPAAPYGLVYKQEKPGFAQASLKKDGKEVAVLSIADTANNPPALEKYKTSRVALAGYPQAAIGSQGTGLLVANRFQVQVRSMAPSFALADREAWLRKFDLDGLAAVRPPEGRGPGAG
jgi:hypothetical protein